MDLLKNFFVIPSKLCFTDIMFIISDFYFGF